MVDTNENKIYLSYLMYDLLNKLLIKLLIKYILIQ